MARPILKWAGLLLAAWLLFHWLTAGQDEIIEGPPENLEGSYCLAECPIP